MSFIFSSHPMTCSTRPCPVCFDPVTTLSTSCCCAGCGRPEKRDSGDPLGQSRAIWGFLTWGDPQSGKI